MASRDKRYPAKFPVVLRKGPEMFGATICNISFGGGCILGVTDLKKGDTVVLDYGSGQTRATAVWTVGRMTGLRFDSRLSNDGLNTIRVLSAPPEQSSWADLRTRQRPAQARSRISAG